MQSIVHTLVGASMYGGINKKQVEVKEKLALFFTSIIGSTIPDIDTVSRCFDTEGMYQMWHRGITHSIFFIPIWALLIYGAVKLIFRVNNKKYFYLAGLAVAIHIFLDLMNPWGTGIFEPITNQRYSLGIVSYRDQIIPAFLILGFILSLIVWKKRIKAFRIIWLLIALYIIFQAVQGMIIYQMTNENYQEQQLVAGSKPGVFRVVGKNQNEIEILRTTAIGSSELEYRLLSNDDADLEPLFVEIPEARTLYRWSPFVVVINNNQDLAIFDPRFYHGQRSFLYYSIKKDN